MVPSACFADGETEAQGSAGNCLSAHGSLRVAQVVLMLKSPPANAGDIRDADSIGFNTWVRKTPGRGRGNPLQYSSLENPMYRGAWWAMVHRVAKSQTRLKRLSTHTHTHTAP